MDIARQDQLILDVAAEEGWGCPCDVIVADDPTGALAGAALTVLDEHPDARLALLSRDRLQADATIAAAEERDLRERVRVAGIDGPLDAVEFLQGLTQGSADGATVTEGTAGADGTGGANPVGASFSAAFALTRLPKSLAELDLIASAVAAAPAPIHRDPAHRDVGADADPDADPDTPGGPAVCFVGGGNTKHMTRTQNDVLARSFREVCASRGQGKFRCLIGAGAATEANAARLWTSTDTPAGAIHGVGGVFGGAKMDRGADILTSAAIDHLRGEHLHDGQLHDDDLRGDHLGGVPDSPAARGDAATFLDLGCGNGSVALALAAAFPAARLVATDVESDAVVSARRTLAPCGDRAEVRWEDAAAGVPDASVDAVLLNPPFHEGTRIDATLVAHLLDAARRVLRPGGHFYLVHNSHLRYRFEVEQRFARVGQLARDPKFTVLHARA